MEKAPLVKSLSFPKGAGRYWYAKSDTATYPDATPPYQTGEDYTDAFLSPRPYDGSMLSPFYRVDLDLNVEPISSLKIMPKEVALALYENWEMTRPVNRQAEYNFLYAPYCDLSGNNFTIYAINAFYHNSSKYG